MLGGLQAPTPETALSSPVSSDWMKGAIGEMLERNPTDARREAFWLFMIMDRRAKEAHEHPRNRDV